MLGFIAIILNRLLERFERIHRLLKYFYYRYPADIFRTRLGHTVLRCLVFCHNFSVFPAHHNKHGNNRNDRRQKARGSHTPVEYEHHHNHSCKQHDGADNIRQIMRQQRFRICRRRIQATAYQAGGVGIKISQRSLHNACHTLLADI